LELVTPATLAFRPIDFLRNLVEEIQRFKLTCPTPTRSETFQRVETFTVHSLAQTHFYLGEWQHGLHYLDREGGSLSTAALFSNEEKKSALSLWARFNQLVEKVQLVDERVKAVLERMAKE